MLNKLKVRYLVVGGIAVVLHGVVRLTADLDLMVELEKKNLQKFFEALDTLGYKPKLPVKSTDFADPVKRREWIEKKNMKVFSFIHPKVDYKLIDVFVDEPIPFEKAYQRRQIMKAKDTVVDVISFQDLIVLKKTAGRKQDLSDIKMLEEIAKENEKK
ncbi:MAG: nucleotidyltransferase [Candidatus Margulisbacteria bacterium]|nr:nucleotidyltransferase [Candidatus Margulisiibacteriota bacterium]MBU1021222.1 nucleotidyltransferase [Candidatus Margulisiibacteriota bacterium]MBU1729828.1 nucleotidyltransferase [Candidatus Margulisiibacteriota bacterium]MBU1955329.1 nucleotidyltransferase [Candidatus Margulisiibacteriota bacterium]